jgi:tetratricopeptide (TPR) repeat protein
MNTFWVTFYSYKGGVGRTMALTNVAALMAKQGRRVLVIDFDLEAPGLDSFEGLGCSKGHPGVVEYVTEYLQTNRAPDITRFVQECRPAGVHLRGNLWLMGCGKKDAAYNRDRASIDWNTLYEHHEGERFVENWKAAIEQTYQPDYVLIDSRTGLTEVGGICTLHLPQLVVLLYALNDQNIHGVAGVARALLNPKNTRPPQILTVATPVPPIFKERAGLLEERLEVAEKELGVKPQCQIHYDPRIALKEQILVWEGDLRSPENQIAMEYDQLRRKIRDYNPGGFDFLLRECEQAGKDLDEPRAEEAAQDLLREFGDRAESHYAIAQLRRAFGRIDEVEQSLRRAVELDPFYSNPYKELIAFLQVKRRLEDAIDISLSRLEALQKTPDPKVQKPLLDTLGELAMANQKYSIAADAYKKLVTFEDNPASALVDAFNLVESQRRTGQAIPVKEYQQLIELYENRQAVEGSQLIIRRLNHQQAMHIPYAMVGRVDEAMELLTSIQRLAAAASPRDRVFCVSSYTHIPLEEWLAENRKMIESLENGTLWDGTQLPTKVSGKQNIEPTK